MTASHLVAQLGLHKRYHHDFGIDCTFSGMIVAFFVATFAVCALADVTQMYRFNTTDIGFNPDYSDGGFEYHCFDVAAGIKTYVRGSYGNYGYFEGAVNPSNPQEFLISWWETTSFEDSLTPNSGSAVLVYDASYANVQGNYWSTGTSDILDSYGIWSAVDGGLRADDSTANGQSTILEKCLYPGINNVASRDDIGALDDTTAIAGQSDQGQTVLCAMGAGPSVQPWAGSYKFVTDDAGGEEKGNLGANSITFWGASGMGLVGTWHASTGEYAGQYGPNLFMVTATTDTTYIVGFSCYIDEDTYKRTFCGPESYVVSGVNQNPQNCPSYYKMDGSLDTLYDFAAVGSDLSNDNVSVVPTAMAILFGCLFGVTLLALIAQCVVSRRAGPLSARADGKTVEL